MRSRLQSRSTLVVGLSLGVALAACSARGPGTETSAASGGGGGATTGGGDGSSSSGDFDPTGPGVGGSVPLGFTVEPSDLQTIAVAAGQTAPSVSYTAMRMDAPINVGWSVDRGELGAISAGPASTATFTPTGTMGGLVTVRAGLNGETVERNVLIQLTAAQNGADAAIPAQAQQMATDPTQLTLGGGVGGVGGEGLGVAVTSTATLDALEHPASDGGAERLEFFTRTTARYGLEACSRRS
ncbi:MULTISPECIES: hypothetical protein [Sorangium]|uniref:Secreted protein n=1 Tax=Sorangium cellulosum TaxID=56 RepID=A0A4P2QQL4_SORCE|nr:MULTISPECIES: hypothetical protein [Sorangium]AUX32171.1 uncharacterized protein SOCE836_043080 [Sorangium cellulosum]WCQ91542.1 hypothetical protein NQZ70_04264 [Sorangium sp. Soce836]